MTAITVLLAEDHAIVRQGLQALLRAESDIKVVAEARTGREAVQLAKKLRPAVIVMDIAMPLLNGIEATRQILAGDPTVRVLILSAHADDEYVERAMAIGAAGYLVKQSAVHVLCDAIRKAHRGKEFFSSSIAKRRDDRRQRSGPAKKALAHLSSRETEVLQLIAEGNANKQTAAELGISIKTVEKHRQSLMAKLDIHDTAGLTRYAVAAGIIDGAVQITIEP